MLKYFDRTFFKFLFGFVGILFFSFLIMGIAVQYQGNPQQAAPTEVQTSN